MLQVRLAQGVDLGESVKVSSSQSTFLTFVTNMLTQTPRTDQHGTPLTIVPTPTQLEDQQSLTPSFALQLCSFSWLTAAAAQNTQHFLSQLQTLYHHF